MVIWVIKIFFVYFFCVSLPPLLNISASGKSMPFLSFIVAIFVCKIPLVSLIFLKRCQTYSIYFPSYCFPVFLFTDCVERLSYLSLEKIPESPLECKFKTVSPKGIQTWIFIGRTHAESESPIFWPPDVRNWLIGKDPDVGKDWRKEEKGMTENEMIGWHHRLNGHEFEQALGVDDGQGGLAYCSP